MSVVDNVDIADGWIPKNIIGLNSFNARAKKSSTIGIDVRVDSGIDGNIAVGPTGACKNATI